MKLRRLILMAIVFLTPNYFGQINPTDLFEFNIIDSLSDETLGTGLWYWGYGDVHMATNGHRIILAAKKTYKDPATNQAKTHLLFGERQGFGKWNFENVYDYRDSLYLGHVKAMLMHGAMPIMFFHDRIDVYKSVPNELKFVNLTGTGWVPTVMVTDAEEDNMREFYIDGSFALSQGDDGATAYWFRGVSPEPYREKKVLVSQNWGTNERNVIWETEIGEDVSLTPSVTKDGEYIAVSHFTYDTLHSYWVIRVFRRSSDGYVEELADTTIDDRSYYYLDSFSFAIGKENNGDVLLIAGGNLGRYIYRRTADGWTKLTENYPSGGGIGSQTASGRPLANERIQFSSDGTAFWGDIDGWGTNVFSAEISFYTPDGRFGYISYPQLPGYPWGFFEFHDFCITDDDTLHIVYNYKPAIENPSMYLVEGKLYIPDLLKLFTSVEIERTTSSPDTYSLDQNYPNPFNPSTTITYSIKEKGKVQLKIYDILGNEITTLVDEEKPAGNYSVQFDINSINKSLSSGVYIYTLRENEFVKSKKMLLIK